MNMAKACWLKEVEHDLTWELAGRPIICIVPILATSKKEP
jgi:hypothetical protein